MKSNVMKGKLPVICKIMGDYTSFLNGPMKVSLIDVFRDPHFGCQYIVWKFHQGQYILNDMT